MRDLRGRFSSISLLLLAVAPVAASGCASGGVDAGPETEQDFAALSAPGALVGVSMKSRVGVVLDEIPPEQRNAAASFYLAQPSSFWIERAKRQIRHTNYRLVYRNFFYDDKMMLALPPEAVWNIALNASKPKRVVTDDGHDAVSIPYTLTSTIVTDVESPAAAEPKLRRIGGTWKEPFNLPLDPEFLFQRTGWACMDEDGYPLNTAMSENAHQLFDQDCDVETPDEASCHLSEYPEESCLDALANHVGRVDTSLRFERLAYTKAAADKARFGVFTQEAAPDLAVLPEGLKTNWIEYRYFTPDSCAIFEQCVGGPGWRRLLLFDASIRNSGKVPLSVGSVEPDSPAAQHNMFELSACHGHYHFRHYGDFSYGPIPGDKRAFCVESTDRYFNNELTPLVHEFGCENQGVAVGWGDTYIAGVECNWIDVTDLAIPSQGVTQDLRFKLNPDNFLCEGDPVLDADGVPVYEPTDFVTETGEPVGRPVCDFASGYASNNLGTRPVLVPKEGGLVTAACTRLQAGPLRDCGFAKQKQNVACRPGRPVRLSCSVPAGAANQVLRACDSSAKLGGVPCMYADSLANSVIKSSGTNVTFTCPASRDATEPGGTYALYAAPVLPTDAAAPITCTPR
ncbi:MAG: lysyl oxidase family protein [Polyangiaceae bacterium]